MSRRLEVCLKCVWRILLKIERSSSLDDVVISRRTIHCQFVVRRISSSFLSFSLVVRRGVTVWDAVRVKARS